MKSRKEELEMLIREAKENIHLYSDMCWVDRLVKYEKELAYWEGRD